MRAHRSIDSRRRSALLAVVAALALEMAWPGAAEPPAAAAAIPGAWTPLDGVLSAGQPTPPQLEHAARAGLKTVINLRSEAEAGFEWERAAAERLGLRYVPLPVAGAADLTRENVERLDRALREALAGGPVLLHCASGNRVGALLALREAWLHGAEPEAALAFGRASGLTGLEPQTRELLGLPATSEERLDRRTEREEQAR
jgi:uncharacterized protein (TIGR01244 family)